jgi:hypothetical protein
MSNPTFAPSSYVVSEILESLRVLAIAIAICIVLAVILRLF